MENEQEGILTIVARTAGIKLKVEGVESSWINPTDGLKKVMLKDLTGLKAMQGKEVTIFLNAENQYTGINLVEEVKPDKVKEERLDEGSESPKEVIDELIEEEVVPKQPEEKTVKDKTYFEELSNVKCTVKKKGTLSYVSWAEAWGKLKQIYPTSTFKVHENPEGMPYFADSTGGFVKVSVTVKDITHAVHLPIMDNRNKSIKLGEMTTFDINKNIQRAFVKSIALHGLSLHVFNGSDFPELE